MQQPQQAARRLVGARIRQLRHKRGWSIDHLADRTGFHSTYVSGIERGRRNPSMWSLIRLAAALECRVGNLFPPEAEALPVIHEES